MNRKVIVIMVALLLSGCSDAGEQIVGSQINDEKSKWYEGGTLHTATMEDWLAGTEQNRLATAGDLFSHLARRTNPALIDRIPQDQFSLQMKQYASDMRACITKVVQGSDVINKINEIAVLCYTMMKSKK